LVFVWRRSVHTLNRFRNISCPRKSHLVPFYRTNVAGVLAHPLPRTSRASSDMSFRDARLKPADTWRTCRFHIALCSSLLPTQSCETFSNGRAVTKPNRVHFGQVSNSCRLEMPSGNNTIRISHVLALMLSESSKKGQILSNEWPDYVRPHVTTKPALDSGDISA
jgi:hypothetical protein